MKPRRISTVSLAGASDLGEDTGLDIGDQHKTLYDQIQNNSGRSLGSESSMDSVFSSASKTAEDDAMLHIAAAITTLREQLNAAPTRRSTIASAAAAAATTAAWSKQQQQ